jgi:hypothetical protein
MTLRLNGSTSGFTEIDAPAVAGSNTLTLPGGNGTNGQVLTTDGAGALSFTTVAGAGSLADGSAAAPSVAFASDVNTGIFRAGNDLLAFSTGGTERAQFDASGRLLVRTSSTSGFIPPGEAFTTAATVQVSGSSSSGASSLQATDTVNGDYGLGGSVFLNKRPSNNTGIGNGHTFGSVYFAGWDTAALRVGASIRAAADGSTWTSGACPSRLMFSTTANAASSPTERLRIGNNGSANFFAANDTVAGHSSATAGTSFVNFAGYHSATNTTNGTNSFLVYTNGNVQNTNNSYGAISDIKLKENIVDASPQWDDLKALQVRNYNFKEGQTHTQIGLVAQEVELVSPGLVSESPDRDEDGNDLGTVTKSVNYSVLYMKAVKALQEAMERIETLEGMVAVNNITIDEQQHQLSTLEARLTALEVTP